jgi:TolB-like protein/DNA-binding winged helix-turn-helix (wHTH) protein
MLSIPLCFIAFSFWSRLIRDLPSLLANSLGVQCPRSGLFLPAYLPIFERLGRTSSQTCTLCRREAVLNSGFSAPLEVVVAVARGNGTVRFGVFELDTEAPQLSRNGIRVRLPKQPLQVLCILLERPGEVVTRSDLQKLLWSSDVFVDFDQGLNKSIQKLREALGDSAESPRYIETIPRTGYRFIAPVMGSLDSNKLAPQANQTPANEDTPSVPPGGRGVGQRWIWLALVGFAVVVLLTAGWFLKRQRSVGNPIQSLAILPLDNLSGDPNQEYFADGMTDELTTMLARDSTLRITSRTSAMQYKRARKPLSEIARALNVDAILEGSISRDNSQVHMTLQLIRADTDTHVWAESYDRDNTHVAALPNEAARDIAARLHSSVASTTSARYINPEAHDAYLLGRFLWFRGQNEEAGREFRKAVELQPDYALAWAGLSNYYGVDIVTGRMNPVQTMQQAEAAAQKAVDLDDQSAEGHLSLGASIFTYHWDFARGLQEVSRAIELDPRLTQAIHMRARFLNLLGRYQEAIQAQKTASEIDPFERPWAMVTILDEERQYDAALAEAHQKLAADPQIDMYKLIALAYRGKGMPREWAQAYEKQLQLEGNSTSAVAVEQAFQRGGQKAVIHWRLDQLQNKSKTSYVSPVDLALLYAQLGDREKTLSFLEQGFLEHSPLLLWIQTDPAYDFLHADPQWHSLIRRIGLPPSY